MGIEPDVVLFPVVVAEKVGLNLTAELLFLEMAVGEFVAVVGSRGDDGVFVSRHSGFLLHLAIQRGDEIFPFVDSSLGELPASRIAHALCDENLSALRLAENRSNVGTVGGHAVGKIDSGKFRQTGFTSFVRFGKIPRVKKSQRNSQASARNNGSTRWIFLASIAAVLALIVFIVLQSRPAKMVAKKQSDLITGIEKRSPGRIERLVADNYSDRWGFDREDAVVAIVDVGSQFLALVVTEEDETTVIDGDEATVTAKLTFGGNPVGPAGQEVVKRLNRLKEPFVFRWRKESFLPASWRLVSIENKSLPDDLWGYEPGDIRRAMQGDIAF